MAQETLKGASAGFKEPPNLELDRLSVPTAFILISSKLADRRETAYRHFGSYQLVCSRGELPEEVARIAEVLGLGRGHYNRILLNIDVGVQLLSRDLDSINRIALVFPGKERELVYEFDNNYYRLRTKPARKKATLEFKDTSHGNSGDFKKETRQLKSRGVLEDVGGAFGRLCVFLNLVPLQARPY